MPIKIPNDLPARALLEKEGVDVMDETTAVRQDIRPLRIGLLNLMPNKQDTEVQFARLIGATPLQIDLRLIRMETHTARPESHRHLEAFYRPWSHIRDQKFDGFVITGAPLGMTAYKDVHYWDELQSVLSWTTGHVHGCLFVCWGAMAALKHFHGIDRDRLPQKALGIFPHHKRANPSPYLRGFNDTVSMPVSRWTRLNPADAAAVDALSILLEADDIGPGLIVDEEKRRLFMFNHLEYDTNSLLAEYERDTHDGCGQIPVGYFRSDDPNETPVNQWRAHGHLLVTNWLSEIYRSTPFDIDEIGNA